MKYSKFLVLLILVFTSCRKTGDLGSIGQNLSPDISSDAKKLTENFEKIPSAYDVNDYINGKLRGNRVSCPIAEDKFSQDKASSKNQLCDYPELGKKWIQNCEKLFTEGEIPKDALTYALKAFRKNSKSFQNKNCYMLGDTRHYSIGGMTRDKFEGALKNGIPNKCQIVINNTKEKLSTYRGRMYYIDICKGSVVKSYFNMGTGKKFQNVSNQKSTVKGVFLTGMKTFDFSSQKSGYKEIRRKAKDNKADALTLVGLQSTNNGSAVDYKYMHVSPYQSSHGCPSISGSNAWMIKELAKNGPSMVVNYADGMQDIDDVKNCGPRKGK